MAWFVPFPGAATQKQALGGRHPPGDPPLWQPPASLDAHQLRYGGRADHQLLVLPQEEPQPGAVGVLVVGQLLLLQVLGHDGFDL